MNKKSLPIWIKILVILLFSSSAVSFGILFVFFMKNLYLGIISQSIDDILAYLLFSLIPGLIFCLTLIILLVDYKSKKKEKNKKWYLDKFLLGLTPVWIMAALTFFYFYCEENNEIYLIISIIIFLSIGITTTPNVVVYALNDMKDWKNIIYKKGNIANFEKDCNFYEIQAPVFFEKKIFFAILKHEVFTILFVVIGIILFLTVSYFNNAQGRYLFFGILFLVSFWIPIIAYYITNIVYRLRVVKCHEYIVYHAIVDSVNINRIIIFNNEVNYYFDFCTCVGIKPKDINSTKVILVFVPDNIYLFPEMEE